MGSIKNVRVTSNNKIEYTVTVDYEEDLLLKGHKTNAHVFSEESAEIETKIISRGRGNTKYIKVPGVVSKGINSSSITKCLRMDSGNRIIIFTVIQK